MIVTGDLIAVRSVKNLLGRLTQIITRHQYTHTGIAYWFGGELFVAELNGGRNHLIPICQLDDYDVFAHPDDLEADRLEHAVRAWLRLPVNYGYLGIVAIGLLNLFRIKFFVHWRRILVCSGYCVAIWQHAGMGDFSRVISPGDLTVGRTLKLSVRPGPKLVRPSILVAMLRRFF